VGLSLQLSTRKHQILTPAVKPRTMGRTSRAKKRNSRSLRFPTIIDEAAFSHSLRRFRPETAEIDSVSSPGVAATDYGKFTGTLSANLGLFFLFEQRHGFPHLLLEVPFHQIQHLPYQGVPHRIKHLVPGLSRHHDLPGAQHSQVLGKIRLLQFQPIHERTYGQFSVAQQVQDRDPCGMSEGLKDFCFELPQRVWHNFHYNIYSKIRILAIYFPKLMSTPNPSIANRILVVDDEPIIADTLKLILDRNGFKAAAAYDGIAAVELAEESAPDILLCDVIMPGLDGVEVAIRVRAIHPACRVLLLSGQAGVEDLLRKARARGHHFDILIKPIHPTELLKILR
jgi:CheY-like chemotaxis protein